MLAVCLAGCQTVGDKATNLSIIYGAAAGLSLLLLIGCCILVKRKKVWFVLLFSSVLVVNIGYTLKFHNKNLYGKLGVSSRKQLLEVYRASNAMQKS